MKILAINGSPNKEGSTAKLINLLVEACEKAGAECEKVQLEDYMIEDCLKCGKCSKEGECGIDDDYLHLKAKMVEASGLIIGSPYYNGLPVENLQVFMDRLSISVGIRNLFADKYVVGVSTSAVNDCRNVAEYCANFGITDGVGGGIVSGLLYECMVTNEGVKDINDENNIKQKADELAAKLLNDINKKSIPLILKLKRLKFFQQINPFFNRIFKRNEAASK